MLVPAEKVKVHEIDGEGLASFLNKPILLMGFNYFYTGILTGINDSCVKLAHPKIVYETGEMTASTYKEAKPLPSPWYVQMNAFESFGPGKS